MKKGSILHHKYFNGVVSGDRQNKYQSVARDLFDRYGMYGSGMMKFITQNGLDTAQYQLRNVDLLIDFSNENKLDIHYNTVLTGRRDAMPETYKTLSKSGKLTFLEKHVRFLVDRYRDKVSFFKLVNEVTREPDDNYLDTGLTKSDLLSKVFEWAVDTYPEGKYMINEHAVEIREEVRTPFLNLVSEILSKGSRIDIVGVQGHMGYFPRFTFLPPDDLVLEAINQVKNQLNLPIFITEFDVNSGEITDQPIECDGLSYANWYEYQKFAYRHFPELLENSGLIDELYYWSLVDDLELLGEKSDTGLFSSDWEDKGYI